MKIKVKRIDSDAKIPTYAHPGDAGMDLYSLEERIILPGERVALRTGIAMEIPDGYAGLVWDKSGVSTKRGIKVIAGVIDSGYIGEIGIGMTNIGNEEQVFKKGDKVAQMLIQKIERAEFEEVENLEETSRGSAGFGSTGK